MTGGTRGDRRATWKTSVGGWDGPPPWRPGEAILTTEMLLHHTLAENQLLRRCATCSTPGRAARRRVWTRSGKGSGRSHSGQSRGTLLLHLILPSLCGDDGQCPQD